MKAILTALTESLSPWWVLGVAAVGGASVVAGVFDPRYTAWWFALLVGLAVAGILTLDTRARLRGRVPMRPFVEIEGPLLWTVAAWMGMRVFGVYGGHVTPLAAAVLAWQVAFLPARVAGFSVGAALVLEVGLTAAGRQSLLALGIHFAVFAILAYGLKTLASSEAFRRRLDESLAIQAKARDDHERARAFGLLTTQAPALRELPRLDGARLTVGRLTLDYLSESFNLQLELLRESLELTTAVVLWRDPGGAELHLRGCATSRDDVLGGPYAAGAGLPASVLGEVSEVAVAPFRDGFGRLPYYRDTVGIGGVMAVAIPEPGATLGASPPAGVLCVDRLIKDPFTEAERQVLRLAARKLSLDVATGQRLKASDHERVTVGRFCAGLQELNGTLGLEQVATAALEAVRALVPVDMAVVSTLDDLGHRIIQVHGAVAERYLDKTFPLGEGLVSQAIKVDHVLPVGGEYRGNQSLFSREDRLESLRSLLVVPLKNGDGDPLGALTVGAHQGGVFASPHKEMLELIANQVAVKLDLAHAHEQIREMATTDGLTGLRNHRTFQQAFDTMLVRAGRRGGPLCFILTDIDHFKKLNDTYGHPFGDLVLKRVARVLSDAVRKVDLAARYGGEEFALILEDSDRDGGRNLAERIRAEIQSLVFEHDSGPVKVTMSLGLAAFPEDGRAKTELIDRADQALYHAKHSGRNRVTTWSEVRAD